MSAAARHEAVTRWRNKVEREHGHGRLAGKRGLMTDHLSADLAAFLAEHERFGDLDTGVMEAEPARAWVTCTCGARMEPQRREPHRATRGRRGGRLGAVRAHARARRRIPTYLIVVDIALLR
jgi:hypothetical protein